MASSSSSNPNGLYVDEFYFSALFDSNEIYPICDEKYAEELHLQEALMASSIHARIKRENMQGGNDQNAPTRLIKVKREFGESSNPPNFHHFTATTRAIKQEPGQCLICMDMKPNGEVFATKCNHWFCTLCFTKYVETKIQQHNFRALNCPEVKCGAVLEPQSFRAVVPREVMERWENGSLGFCCPFKDCGAMMVDHGSEVVAKCECPTCKRMFCAQCKVPWHVGVECEEVQKLGKGDRDHEDIMLMELAKNKQWRRCPNCKIYVEKNEGCLHITCRCGYEFCYGCGVKWSNHVCGK